MKNWDEADFIEIVNNSGNHQDLLYTATFYKDKDDLSSKCVAELYESYVLIKQPKLKIEEKTILQRISFSFDLIFEIIKQKKDEKKQESESLFALKFQKFSKSYILYTQDEDMLQIWRNLLSQHLNQRGFHSLFKPVKKIGKGNFASVYLAIRLSDNRKCAVKAFSKEATYAQDRGKESLINEIQLMRKLNHKNLLHLYEIYQSQNSIYVCLQLLQGGQLYDKIKAKHKFTFKQAQTVTKALLSGTQQMTQRGIMHRDIKPQNILLRKQNDYDCVIADFGLSEQCNKKQYLFVRCGTPGYVAPEVVNIKDMKSKIDPICNVFSIGIIFHILLIGKSPFPGKTYNQVLAQNRACQFDFNKSEYNDLSPEAFDLLKRMLQKDHTKRITAHEALKHSYFDIISNGEGKELSQQLITNNKKKQPIHKTSILEQGSVNSPLMTSNNPFRKLNQQPLKDDSCVKFVMKQNVLTGHVQSQQIKQNDSPSIVKKIIPTRKAKQSRFGIQSKQLAQLNADTSD